MGKRELLLFLGFLLFGGVVYQVTAPKKEETKEGFSFSKFVEHVQAEIKGEHVETVIQRSTTAAAPEGEGWLVIPAYRGTLTIIGDQRSDLTAELKAIVYGMDDEQSKTRAKDTNVTLESDGDNVKVNIAMPEDMKRRPQLDLILRVPAHIGLQLELRGGQADLRRIQRIQLENSRGKITMADVGDIEGTFENGNIEVVHARGVTLKTARAQVRLEEIAGELKLESVHGELRLQQIHGPSKLALERLDCEVDGLHGPSEIEPERVNLSIRNIAAALTVKGENTEVRATMIAPVPVTIETTDDLIDLRAPPAGVTIDAKSDGGQIRIADSGGAESDEVERPEKPEKREPTEKPEGPEPPEPPAPPQPPMGARDKDKPAKTKDKLQKLEKWKSPETTTSEHDEHDTREQHTVIKLHGGGPTIALRNTRGDIVIR
jgi:hypothetical protein